LFLFLTSLRSISSNKWTPTPTLPTYNPFVSASASVSHEENVNVPVYVHECGHDRNQHLTEMKRSIRGFQNYPAGSVYYSSGSDGRGSWSFKRQLSSREIFGELNHDKTDLDVSNPSPSRRRTTNPRSSSRSSRNRPFLSSSENDNNDDNDKLFGQSFSKWESEETRREEHVRNLQNVYPTKTSSASGPPLPSGPTKTPSRTQTRSRSSSSTPSTLPSATPSPYPSCSCQQALWTTDPGNVTNADLASMKLSDNYTRRENGTYLYYTSYLFSGLLTPFGNYTNTSSPSLSCNIGWGTNAKLDKVAPSPSPSSSFIISASNTPRLITMTQSSYPTCVNITNPTPSSSMTSSSSPSPSMQPAPVWVQLRITPIYYNVTSDAVGMTPSKVDFVQNVLIKNAILKWSNLLMTIPVSGNLFASRECMSWWATTTPASCASFAQVTTCGPGGSPFTSDQDDDVSIPIPSDYLLRQNNYTLLNATAKPGSPDFGLVTPDMYFPRGSGLSSTDFAIFVTTQHVPSKCAARGSSQGTLAYSMTCQRDQFDRPTWARINICPFALLDPLTSLGYDGLNGYLYRSQFNAILHEIGHALGFSSLNWPLHRTSLSDYLRSPKTPRDPLFPGQTSDEFVAYYSCGSANRKNINERDVPSNNTVAYFNERGTGGPLSCLASKFIGKNASIPLDADFTGPGNSWSGRQVGRNGMAGRGSVILASMGPSTTPSTSTSPSTTPSNTSSPLPTKSRFGVSQSSTQTPSPTQTPTMTPTPSRSFTSTSTNTPAPPPPVFSLSGCVHKLVGPRVQAAAKVYFDCEDIQGGELENQLFGGDEMSCDFQGSHWESRILAHEIMATNVGYYSKIGPLTLAAFEDSGWYLANYSNADGFIKGASWGYQMGCEFAFQSTCLTPALNTSASTSVDEQGKIPQLNDNFPDSRHFYTFTRNQTFGNSVCTLDRSSVATVEVIDYSLSLPSQFQYYSSSNRGGSNLRFGVSGGLIGGMSLDRNYMNGSAFAASLDTFDFCPIAQAVGISNDIIDKTLYNGPLSYMEKDVPITQTRRCESYLDGLRRNLQLSSFGEIYGQSSACFESTLIVSGGVTRGAKLPKPIGAGCFQYECDLQNPGSLYIIINGTASNGVLSSPVIYHKVFCDFRRGGLSFNVPGFDGVITCPDGGADVLCKQPEVVDVPYPLSMLVNRTSPLVSILPTPSNSPTISTTATASSSFKLPSATPSETPSGSTSPGPMCVTAILVLENVFADNVTTKFTNFSIQTMPIYAALINYSSSLVKVASVRQVQKQVEVRARRLSAKVSSPLYQPMYSTENSNLVQNTIDSEQRSLATTSNEICYCTNSSLVNVTGVIVQPSRNCTSGVGSNSVLYSPSLITSSTTPYLGKCSNSTVSITDSQLILIIRYYAYISIDTLAATSTVNNVIANIVKGFLPPQEMSSWDAYFNTQETIRLSLLDELTEKISTVIGISKNSFSLYLLSTPTAKAGLGSFDIPPPPPIIEDNSALFALLGSLVPFLLVVATLAGIEWLKRYREKLIAIREIDPILLPEDRSTVAKPAPRNFLPRALWNLETRLRQERIEKIELGHMEPMTEEEMKLEVKAHAESIRNKKKWNREEWKKDLEIAKMLHNVNEKEQEIDAKNTSPVKSTSLLAIEDKDSNSPLKTKVSIEVPMVLFFNSSETKIDNKLKKRRNDGQDLPSMVSKDVVSSATLRNVHSVPLSTLTSFLSHAQPADDDHILLHVGDDNPTESKDSKTYSISHDESTKSQGQSLSRPVSASSTDSNSAAASQIATMIPTLQQKAEDAGRICKSLKEEIHEIQVFLKNISIASKERKAAVEKLEALSKGLKVAEVRSARANAAFASASALAFAKSSNANSRLVNTEISISTDKEEKMNEVDKREMEEDKSKETIGIRVPLNKSEIGLFVRLDARVLFPIFSELKEHEKPGYIRETNQSIEANDDIPPPFPCDLCRVRRAMRTCYGCERIPVVMPHESLSSTLGVFEQSLDTKQEEIATDSVTNLFESARNVQLRFLHMCVDCFVSSHGKNRIMRQHLFADLTLTDSRLTEKAPGGPLHLLLLDRAAATQHHAETVITTFSNISNIQDLDEEKVEDDDDEIDINESVSEENESIESDEEEEEEDDEDEENDSQVEEDVIINSLQEEKESDEIVSRVSSFSSRQAFLRIECKEDEGKNVEEKFLYESKVGEEETPTSPNGGDIPGSVIRW
jgi:hypothetical protein